jgi:hypothetical protein
MQANENYSRQPIGDSELILNADKSLYHLGVAPGQIAPFVLIVGDPERVESISSRFDSVEVRSITASFAPTPEGSETSEFPWFQPVSE